jgi:glycosyltransferase involved in cell wall biosynthesis
MHILFVHASSDLYGSDRVLWQLIRSLSPEVRADSAAVLPYQGPLVGLLRSTGIRVHVGPLAVVRRSLLNPLGILRFGLDLVRSIGFLRSLVRQTRFDLVYSNTSAVLSGAVVAKLEGLPHCWHVHEIITHPRWFARSLAGFVAATATLVIANSRQTAANLSCLAPRVGPRVRIVYNGARSELEAPPPAPTLRSTLGVPADGVLVGVVGRINRWKGHKVFVEAAAQLAREHPSARFLVVGSAFKGEEHLERDLEQTIRSFPQLTQRLYRMPEQEDIAGVYAALDVVAIPSTEPEPFGLVAVEAMALGRPVVASRIGALPEVIEDGRSGLLVEPSSASALANALRRLINEPELRRRLGQAGLERQRTLFNEKRFITELVALLEQASGQQALSPGG